MTESKIDSFNIEPLVFEIEKVIKNGLKELLKDYIVRHDLLEKTHKQIMKLPSVMNEINKGVDSDSEEESDYVENKSMFISINDMTRDLVKKEISHVESKLDRIEKKYESISPLISKILDKLESINDEVKVLRETPRDNIKIVQMDHEKPYISNIIKPSIVSACENENIKFEIDENDDDEEESDEEGDVNQEVIACPTITLTKSEPIEIKKEKEDTDDEDEDEDEDDDDEVEVVEPVKIKKEVIVIKEEDEEEQIDEAEEAESEEQAEEADEVETEASDEEEAEEEEEASEEQEEEVVVPAATKVEEDEEAELEIITIDDIDYCTNDMETGFIWELSEDGEQGDKIGYLKEGEPFFYADEN